MKYGNFNHAREYNVRALFALSLIFIFNTHCIYVYFIVFYGQSVIPK